MADLYQPRQWADGEQLTAANAANRWENGLEALDLDLDDLHDAVLALQAGGGSSRQFQSGPFPPTIAPAIGLPYYATDLVPPRVIVGSGTTWTEFNGAAILDTGGNPGPGTGTSPTGMTATVTAGGSIGAINLSWNPVAGAASYKLYETESPNGVNGATALTTTSSVRTPGVARNYEYWVTALVNGVESASSNRVQATLPYVASGGGGTPTGTDPSTFLNINGKGNGTGGWWNLGIGYSTGHVDITPTQLQNGFIDSPYYAMSNTGTEAAFQVFMNGGTTSSNTQYPRSELREFATGSTSTRASWNPNSGTHIMRGKTKIIHYAPQKQEVCIAQAHDTKDVAGGAGDDTLMLKTRNATELLVSLNGSIQSTSMGTFPVGTEIAWELRIVNGAPSVLINGVQKWSAPASAANYVSGGFYWKTGCYAQQNTSSGSGNPSTEYCRTTLRDLFVSHS